MKNFSVWNVEPCCELPVGSQILCVSVQYVCTHVHVYLCTSVFLFFMQLFENPDSSHHVVSPLLKYFFECTACRFRIQSV